MRAAPITSAQFTRLVLGGEVGALEDFDCVDSGAGEIAETGRTGSAISLATAERPDSVSRFRRRSIQPTCRGGCDTRIWVLFPLGGVFFSPFWGVRGV